MEKSKAKLLRNKIKGMIYGQCLGDAVGLITEFKFKRDRPRIKFPYTEPIRDYPICDWSDDSDQMILLLETIINSDHDFRRRKINIDDIKFFAKRMDEWRRQGFPELGDTRGLGIGGTTNLVLTHPEFLSDPHSAAREIWYNSGKKLAANGAVMRTSILSIMYLLSIVRGETRYPKPLYENIQQLCEVTHTDPRCVVSCWAVCFICQQMILAGLAEHPRKFITDIHKECWGLVNKLHRNLIKDTPGSSATATRHQPTPRMYLSESFVVNGQYDVLGEFKNYLQLSHSLEALKLDELGKIGYTFKCLGCGLWALYQLQSGRTDFKEMILEVVRECGDADTNAAVAGAILGAYLGFEALPVDWVEALPNGEWLDKKISELFERMGL
jgi:ADP-ribosylglycohydrolase